MVLKTSCYFLIQIMTGGFVQKQEMGMQDVFLLEIPMGSVEHQEVVQPGKVNSLTLIAMRSYFTFQVMITGGLALTMD